MQVCNRNISQYPVLELYGTSVIRWTSLFRFPGVSYRHAPVVHAAGALSGLFHILSCSCLLTGFLAAWATGLCAWVMRSFASNPETATTRLSAGSTSSSTCLKDLFRNFSHKEAIPRHSSSFCTVVSKVYASRMQSDLAGSLAISIALYLSAYFCH